MINSYSFGKIIIDKRSYRSDLIISPEKIHSNWRREKGHNLIISDFTEIDFNNIKKVIIGKGFPGLMKVSKEVISLFENKKIELFIKSTPKSVKEYNRSNPKTTIAMFHLTC